MVPCARARNASPSPGSESGRNFRRGNFWKFFFWGFERFQGFAAKLKPRGAACAVSSFEGLRQRRRLNSNEGRRERTRLANREHRVSGRSSTLKERAPWESCKDQPFPNSGRDSRPAAGASPQASSVHLVTISRNMEYVQHNF